MYLHTEDLLPSLPLFSVCLSFFLSPSLSLFSIYRSIRCSVPIRFLSPLLLAIIQCIYVNADDCRYYYPLSARFFLYWPNFAARCFSHTHTHTLSHSLSGSLHFCISVFDAFSTSIGKFMQKAKSCSTRYGTLNI